MTEMEDLLKRGLSLVTDQANELEGRVQVLALALRDIEAIAREYVDYDTDALNRILHIVQTGGVQTAIDPT